MTLALIAIVVAAVVGSFVGSFFEGRLTALIWSTPLVGFVQVMIMLIAPEVRGNMAAPGWLRDAVHDLADPALLVQLLVASATGTLVASSMLRHVRKSRRTPFRLPHMDQGSVGRRTGDAAPSRAPRPTGSRALNARIDNLRTAAPRRAEAFAPLPVYEVAPEPPRRFTAPRPEPAAAEPAAAAPARPNNRSHVRRRSVLAGHLLLGNGTSSSCTIQNLSVGGAQVRLAAPLAVPHSVCLLDLSNWLAHEAEIAWRKDTTVGLRFRVSYDLSNPQDAHARELQKHCAALAPR